MSYHNKLTALLSTEQQLQTQKKSLIEKRKQEIGNLAQQFELLTVSNTLLIGLFATVQQAIKTNSSYIKEWEMTGERFRKSKKRNNKAAEKNYSPTSQTASSIHTYESP